jgi:GDP-L-fucose synthase
MPSLAGARVLVTGGGGFLGGHIVAALRAAGAEVLAPRRVTLDLRSEADVRAWFRAQRPAFVVHAAATGGGIGWMKDHPADAYVDNIRMSTSVLEAAREIGVRGLVGVSSACAYAVDAVQPMREESVFAGEPEPTNGPYGHAKRAMLVHGAALAQQHAFPCGFVVPTNLYGPGDDTGPARSHLVGALLRRFEDARAQGLREVTCWGTGRATRDLLYAPDCAEGIVAALQAAPGAAPINLGSGVERTVAEIARAVADAVGWEGTIHWDATKPDGMPRKVLDTGRARERLGWTPRTSLAEGLRETVAWYRAQG